MLISAMTIAQVETFIRWSPSHWWALIAIVLIIAGLLLGIKKLDEHRRWLIAKILGSAVLLTFLLSALAHLTLDHTETWQERLPLHFCGVMSIICFIALWTRQAWACALSYFGVLTASIQALITPMLFEDFPSRGYFSFFIIHGLLFISALAIPCLLKWRARPWDALRCLLLCDLYLLFIIPMNILLHTNFGFTNEAPPYSILDYFGSPPWYFLSLQVPAFLVFQLLYLMVRHPQLRRY
ncbi:MAG: TIGR02206 family membrane protein [Akkermansia sp.]